MEMIYLTSSKPKGLPVFTLKTGQVQVGSYILSMEDFCRAADAVLADPIELEDDPRKALLTKLKANGRTNRKRTGAAE